MFGLDSITNNYRNKLGYNSINKKIINLKEADLKLRKKLILSGRLSDGYNPEMEQLHVHNAIVLNEIIDTIGYPTFEKVGKEASDAAWLIIQHSIGNPDFMKKCKTLLEIAVGEGKAEPLHLAYLTDRIAVLEGKPQLYGTQFDWDEKGRLSPNAFDDITKVNHRRKMLGLNTIEDQTEIMRERLKAENQQPPTDFEKRKLEMDKWRRKTGWLK